MSRQDYLFTSESVSEGHPDKVCDRISDEIVDLVYREAKKNGMSPWDVRIACETLATTNRVVIAGEVRVPPSLMKKNKAGKNIVNPAKLDYVRANDTCIQCHSQGQPLKNPIAGQYYDWAVGFHQGGQLQDYWKLEEHKLGDTNFMHFADGTAHKNRMQGNDFVQSVMYRRGVTCFDCHDVHGTSNNADLIKPVGQLCLTCHGPTSPNGPRAPSIEQHTHHSLESAGSQCVNCHMPKIEQTMADINVRSHTFEFITPGMTDEYKIPNPCTGCHTDKTTDWAREALRSWSNVSPWRVE